MNQISIMRRALERAKTNSELSASDLEPDPKADPLTYLDQQWRQERAKYVGTYNVDNPSMRPNPLLIGSMLLVWVGFGVSLLIESFVSRSAQFVGGAMLFMLTSLLVMLAFRNTLRFALAERRYEQKRRILLATLGYADQTPTPAMPYPQTVASYSEAETAFYALQNETYEQLLRDQTYYAKLHGLIRLAPEADQAYLKALAELEEAWARERLAHFKLNKKTASFEAPSLVTAWVLLGAGLAIIGFGFCLIGLGKPLTYAIMCWLFGQLLIASFFTIRQQIKRLELVDQRYFAKRQKISHDYGR